MQFDLNLGVAPGSNAEKSLEIEPYNEQKAAWERFEAAREYNKTVHAGRRAVFGRALAHNGEV